MASTTAPADRPAPAAAGAPPPPATRLFFVDNIRLFLTALVILHHLMITYAGSGGWYYEEGREDLITGALGTWFCTSNQAYFMGLFLLISAYFTPGSYDRKGAWRFMKDRLIRLGIPLVIYSWIIHPLLIYLLRYGGEGLRPMMWADMLAPFTEGPLLGSGPLWFVTLLLILSALYVLWRKLRPAAPATPPAPSKGFPSNRALILFGLGLWAATFAMRLQFKADQYTFVPLNFQLAYFAQYLIMFVVGLAAYRRNWLLNMPDQVGKRWLWVAAALFLILMPLAAVCGAFESVEPFQGGWYWQGAVYMLWEAFFCLSACISVVYLFRRYANVQTRLTRWLAPNAYTAYILHAPVLVLLAGGLRGVELYPFLKFVIMAPIALATCWGLSALIRKLPYTDRVL